MSPKVGLAVFVSRRRHGACAVKREKKIQKRIFSWGEDSAIWGILYLILYLNLYLILYLAN